MNTSFDELHGQHILLLSRKEGGEPAASLVKEARNLLQQLRAIGRQIADRQQRILLESYAAYWGAFIYDGTGVYPKTTLDPAEVIVEDFVLRVDGVPGAYTVAALSEQEEALPFVLASDEVFCRVFERVGKGEPLWLKDVKAVGALLFDALFPRRVWRAYSHVLTAPIGQVRLKLDVRPPELARLPWEWLYDEEDATFLLKRHPIVRTVDEMMDTTPLKVRIPLRVLYVQGSSVEQKPLALARRQEALKKSLAEWAEMTKLLDATPDLLRDLLGGNYHILHVDGSDILTKPSLLSQSGASHPLSHASRTMRLALLSACESGDQKYRLGGLAHHLMHASTLPALVGMLFPVKEAAATAFYRAFYRALADGQPLLEAMSQGREAMRDESNDVDWLAPTLFMRVENDFLFDIVSDTQILRFAQDDIGQGSEGGKRDDIRQGSEGGKRDHIEQGSEGRQTAQRAKEIPFLAPPLPTYSLVGREPLLSKLKQRLFAGGKLAACALSGMPGVGKTALAVALAHDPEVLAHFQDGVLWAGLGPGADLMALLGQWATALGIGSDEISKLTTIESRVDRIRATIGMRRMLLVVDDGWRVNAALTFKLGGPNCAHLVTSRFVEIAWQFARDGTEELHELSEEHGLTLLKQLSQQVVAAEPEEAKELVKAVGGLPLGLVLMGNYLHLQGRGRRKRRIRHALDKLKDVQVRLRLEQTQSPAERHPGLPPERPISLEAIMAISDEMLDDAARRTLYALSVFPAKPNTFSEDAALAVTAEEVYALDRLSLSGLLELRGIDRYTLHQAIADYAGVKRTDNETYSRMITFFVNYVEAHHYEYDALEEEMNNILAALDAAFEQGMESELLRGTNAFYHFLEIRGLYALAEKHLSRAEQAARALNDRTGLATTLLNLGAVAENLGDYARAERYCQEGLALANQIGQRDLISALQANLGTVAENRGDYAKAETLYLQGLELARQAENDDVIIALLTNLGLLADNRGDYASAEAFYQESLALAREIENDEKISNLLQNLGAVAWRRGDVKSAEHYFQEGLALAWKLKHRGRMSGMLANLGTLAANRGAYHKAEGYYRKGLALARALGQRERICLLLVNLAVVATNRQMYDQAQSYFEEGLALAKALGDRWLRSAILVGWGELHLAQQNWDLAAATFHQAKEVAQKVGSQEFVARALYGLAQVALGQGHIAQARQQGQESLTIFDTIGHEQATIEKEWLADVADLAA